MPDPPDSARQIETAGPARVAGNAAALLFGQTIQYPVSFVASIFIVRTLGSDGYGMFAFVYAFTGLFEWLATFGIENPLVRRAALLQTDPREPGKDKPGVLFGSALLLSCLTAFGAAGIATLTAFVLGYRGRTAALLAIAGIEAIALVPPRLLGAILQARLEMWKMVAITSTRQLIWLGIVFVLFSADAPVEAFVGARTIIATAEVLAIAVVSMRSLRARLGVLSETVLGLARESWPLAFMYLAISVNLRVDRVLIERLAGPGQLGLYALADNVGGLMAVVPLALGRSVYPEICKRLESEDRFRSAVRSSFRVAVAVVGLAVVALFAAGPFLIRLVYGERFAESGPLLRVLLLGQLGATYGTILGVALLARSLQRAMMVANIVTGVFNLVLNLLVIPRWGALGAAWVTVASYWMGSSLFFELAKRTRELNREGIAVFARALPGLGLGLGAALVVQNHFLAIALSPLLCFFAFAASGIITAEDRDLVRSILSFRRRRNAEVERGASSDEP